MKGKLLIIDSTRHYGKILLADGRESAVKSFPATYESCDIVEVKFINDDPSKDIVTMVAEAEGSFYGCLLLPSRDGKVYRSIITTYPTLIGLVSYSPNALSFAPSQKSQNVKFRISKDHNGKLSACEIKPVVEDESYRCTTPVFGRIFEQTRSISEGYVKQVVKEKEIPADYAEGVISELRIKNQGLENEFVYGFIKEIESGNRIYFTSDNYKRFYGKQPSTGDQTRFIINRSEHGYRVSRFCSEPPKGILPQNLQYCIIKLGDGDYRVPLTDYLKVYDKEPSIGDIVNGISSDHSIELTADTQTALKTHIFTLAKPRSNDVQTGFIESYNSDRGFGFVRLDSDNTTAFFHFSVYQEDLGLMPTNGNRVNVSVRTDEKTGKLKIQKFHRPVEFDCKESQYNDFGSPSIDELYVAYIDSDNQVKEISRANLEQLPLAVAYYKSETKEKRYLMEAVETMIRHRFCDQKITLDKLISDRFRLLNELIRESAENNFSFELDEFQYKLQMLKYDQKKLTSCTNGEKASLIMLSDVSVTEMNMIDTGWEFINRDPEIVLAALEKGWDVAIDDRPGKVDAVTSTSKWDIDMRDLKDILPFDRTQAYFDITL